MVPSCANMGFRLLITQRKSQISARRVNIFHQREGWRRTQGLGAAGLLPTTADSIAVPAAQPDRACTQMELRKREQKVECDKNDEES